jgi:hypothetical protein
LPMPLSISKAILSGEKKKSRNTFLFIKNGSRPKTF